MTSIEVKTRKLNNLMQSSSLVEFMHTSEEEDPERRQRGGIGGERKYRREWRDIAGDRSGR